MMRADPRQLWAARFTPIEDLERVLLADSVKLMAFTLTDRKFRTKRDALDAIRAYQRKATAPECEVCERARRSVSDRRSVDDPSAEPLMMCDDCAEREAYRAEYLRVHPEGEP